MSDRTSEFQSTIQTLQARPSFPLSDANRGPRKRAVRGQSNGFVGGSSGGDGHFKQYSEFMRCSKVVARKLYETYQKLEQINHLAKNRTLFDSDDASRRLNELVFYVRKDINSLNQDIDRLRRLQLDSSKSPSSHSQNIESHSKNVVLTLQQQLAQMSNNFKNTLELRSQNLQEQKARREQFTASSPSLPSSSNGHAASSEYIIDLDDKSPLLAEEGPSLAGGANGGLQNQMVVHGNQGHQYLQERANTMQSIESTIVELGQIFNQLASMVQQQEEMITRIDSNVADTQMNVEAAHESLLRYFASVTNNRWLILKVFGVLFFFFIVFVIFAG